MNVVIDNGYYSTVSYLYPNIHSFRSKVQQSNSPIKFSNTHKIIYNNTHYLVGEGAENIDINLNKSNSLLHLITTLTGLGLFGSNSYNLIANLPLNLYTKESKQSFESYLTRSVDFILNDIPIHISINNVVVFPQSLPVLYINNKHCNAVLDIGGLTVQGCVVNNLNPIQSSIFTENLGTLILMNKIKSVLNNTYTLNIQDYELENIIKHGLSKYPDSLSLVDSICQSYCEQIIKVMKLFGWNLESLNILLTGGGSLILEKYLSKLLPTYYISNSPLNDNVLGLWEVSKHVFKA